MKSVRRSFLTLLAMGLIGAIGHAQEFSADVVYANAAKAQDASSSGNAVPAPPSAKIFVSKNKMRLESRGMIYRIMLVDAEKHSTYALYPDEKAYSKLSSGPPQYFWVKDAENACADWQTAAGREMACQKVGADLVDGRNAIKYKSEVPEQEPEHVWVDAKLKFVIKWDEDKAGAELHNIKEGPQAAELFDIPSTYQVLQPKKKPPTMSKRPK